MDAWLARQRDAVEALAGLTVVAWDGVELALKDESPNGPQFTDPHVRFLQLAWLNLSAGSVEHAFSTYQDDDYFGLRVGSARRASADDCWGIFRWRTLDLPTGRIDTVDVLIEKDVLARVVLTIEGHDLLLVAGEAHATWSGGIEVHRLDESVLVFPHPSDAEAIRWM
jgi:hypothetical protein